VLRVVFLSSLLLLLYSLATLPTGEHDSLNARQQRDRAQADHKARVLETQRQGGTATHMPCDYDLMCGIGECWVGMCLGNGICRAFHTCA
jgi:hypothetical protein